MKRARLRNSGRWWKKFLLLMGYKVLRIWKWKRSRSRHRWRGTTAPIIKGKKLALVPILEQDLASTGGFCPWCRLPK